MAVGSTNTIIYHLYKENRVEISKEIAALMLSGIISDTLALTSPTTTGKDREVVQRLEEISGLDYKEYSKELFGASSDFSKKSEYDLITTDVKTFQNSGRTFKVSQIITMNVAPILERKESLVEELNKFKEVTNSDFAILIITDILSNSSYLLYDDTQLTFNILQRALNQNVYEGMYLEGVVSRKKQLIPLIMEVE